MSRLARALHAWCRWALRGLLVTAGVLAATVAHAQADASFRCGGRVERDVWQLWDDSAREFLRKEMLQNRLAQSGDTYALYDLQGYAHNLVAMAARCHRVDRLKELADLAGLAFDAMVDLPGTAPGAGRGWICRGGRVCNATNKLAGTEVALNSQQFLAFALRTAAALAVEPDAARSRPHIERALIAAVSHLQRWTAGRDPLRLAERAGAKAADVRDAQSRLFFTDQDLWLIDIAAETAGILAALPELERPLPNRGLAGAPREAVVGLLELLRSRTTHVKLASVVPGSSTGADIDRGFWRLYRDSRYAGYRGTQKPVECTAGEPPRVRVPAEQVAIVETIGWDFSHARRLVHVMDSIDRNRDAVRRVFAVPSSAMPDPELPLQFASQLAAAVWKGDRDRPLFANYWDGTDGWYRVGYDNGTGVCLEGYAPSMLSDAFITGGFIAWARQVPLLAELGERLYRLSQSDDPVALDFIGRYYSQLAPTASANNRMLTRLMFWPSLVQWSSKS